MVIADGHGPGCSARINLSGEGFFFFFGGESGRGARVSGEWGEIEPYS